jgi:hypothetical protein
LPPRVSAAASRFLRLGQRTVIRDQLLDHVLAKFFFETVHVFAFALSNDIDHLLPNRTDFPLARLAGG